MSNDTTIHVFFNAQGSASVFIDLPQGVIVPAVRAEHYHVTGSKPVSGLPTNHQVGDFAAWRQAREAEGFVFRLLYVD